MPEAEKEFVVCWGSGDSIQCASSEPDRLALMVSLLVPAPPEIEFRMVQWARSASVGDWLDWPGGWAFCVSPGRYSKIEDKAKARA